MQELARENSEVKGRYRGTGKKESAWEKRRGLGESAWDGCRLKKRKPAGFQYIQSVYLLRLSVLNVSQTVQSRGHSLASNHFGAAGVDAGVGDAVGAT